MFVCGYTIDELVEESPVEDYGYAMTTAAPPSRLVDVLQIQSRGIIAGVENDNTTVHFESITCREDTFEREKQSEKDISFERISELFRRPQEDAAKRFGGMCYSTMFLHFVQLIIYILLHKFNPASYLKCSYVS